MKDDQGKHAYQMQNAPEPEEAGQDERAGREMEALRARLGGEPAAASSEPLERRLQRVEALLRSAPMLAPSPDFAARVMAAVAAMTFPHMLNRRLSLSLMLSMALVAALTLPVLGYGVASLFDALSDPGALNSLMALGVSALGLAWGLAGEFSSSVQTLIHETPMVPALLTTSIPLAMLVGWLVWYLLDGPRWLMQRLAA